MARDGPGFPGRDAAEVGTASLFTRKVSPLLTSSLLVDRASAAVVLGQLKELQGEGATRSVCGLGQGVR